MMRYAEYLACAEPLRRAGLSAAAETLVLYACYFISRNDGDLRFYDFTQNFVAFVTCVHRCKCVLSVVK